MSQLKNFVWLLFGVMGLIFVVIGARPPHAPKDRVIVSYWEKWTGEEAEQMQQIVDDFNNRVGKEKGIYVQYLSMSSVNQKTLVATAAGVPPDVAGLWDAQVTQFAAINALEPLDDLAKEHGISKRLLQAGLLGCLPLQRQVVGFDFHARRRRAALQQRVVFE